MTALRGWCTSPSATANPPFQSRQAQLESGVRGNVPAPFGAGERLQSPTYRYPVEAYFAVYDSIVLTGPTCEPSAVPKTCNRLILSQSPRLDPSCWSRLSSDEQLEGCRGSHNDLHAVVDRLRQRTVENVPHTVPVALAAPKRTAATIAP